MSILFRILLTVFLPAASAESLRVVTWNVWHGYGPSIRGYGPRESRANRQRRVSTQTELLTALQPDVTFLQECNPLLVYADALATALRAEWSGQLDAAGVKLLGFGIPWRLDAGLATLGRSDYRSLGSISLTNPRFNLVRPWGSLQVREERFAHFASVTLAQGTRVLLVNTQLHDGVEFPPALRAEVVRRAEAGRVEPAVIVTLARRLARGDRRRRKELVNLLARARELEPDHDVTLIAGDLNAAPDSDAADVLRGAGFRDAWAEARPNDLGLTYDANVSALNRELQSGASIDDILSGLKMGSDVRSDLASVIASFERRPRRIDYVWVSARETNVLTTSAERVGLDTPDAVTSDHLGLAVDFEITRAR